MSTCQDGYFAAMPGEEGLHEGDIEVDNARVAGHHHEAQAANSPLWPQLRHLRWHSLNYERSLDPRHRSYPSLTTYCRAPKGKGAVGGEKGNRVLLLGTPTFLARHRVPGPRFLHTRGCGESGESEERE